MNEPREPGGELVPFRWFGRDAPPAGWARCPAAAPEAWGLPPLPQAIFPPVTGPWPDAVTLWRTLGEADEQGAGQGRCVAVPRAAFEQVAEQFSDRLGQPVGVGAVVARWAADLQQVAGTAPGQETARPVLTDLADRAERGEAGEGFASLFAERALPRLAALEAPPPGGVLWGEVDGGLVVARVRCEGPCWLLTQAPFAYYEPVRWSEAVRASEVPALPAGLASWWLDTDPVDTFETLLARIPLEPLRWRLDLWLSLLAQITPGALAWAVGTDGARIARLAGALAGTPLFAPLLAAVGERVLLSTDLDAQQALDWARAEPSSLPPSARASALVLQARELFDIEGIALFLGARSLLAGRLDPAHPLLDRQVRAPLRQALLAHPPDAVRADRALSSLWGAGGLDAVRDVLDALVAEGITSRGELEELRPALSGAGQAAISGWLQAVSH